MDIFLTYLGDVRAILGHEVTLAFTTVHPEGRPTAVYLLDTKSDTMKARRLPCGGVALAQAGADLYVAGTDRRVYVLPKLKAPKPLTDPFEFPTAAIAVVSQDRLAVVTGKTLALVSRNDGSVTQTLPLPDTGTCIGTDETGEWLAVGCEKGHVAVFDCEDKAEFEPAEDDKIHDGSVTAILFEAKELRFFSTGADHKLLSTHARGKLEPEDKGRANNHEAGVTAMIALPVGDRILTGSADKTLKNWPRAGATKPMTLAEKMAGVVGLTMVKRNDNWEVAVACDDNSLRLFQLNQEDGRFDEDAPDDITTYRGGMDWARNEFESNWWDTKALKQLAVWNDTASLELLAKRIGEDHAAARRLMATKLLGAVTNPRVATLLEPHLTANDQDIRTEVFKGLQCQLGKADFRPIDAALKTGHPDIGVLALNALTPLASQDDQALARIIAAVNAKEWSVRRQALRELEVVFDTKSPRASLTALGSTFADLRAFALLRFYQRKMLDHPEVVSAVRRKLEDDDATVRGTAFWLSLLARPSLAAGLRSLDEEWHRQLTEIEGGKDAKQPEEPKGWRAKLEPADLDTLLQATASRALDTCLRGAKGLALLGDARAFPLLLQLSREEEEFARVEVCRALGALGDPRAVSRLRSMLLDPVASVRDAGFTAVAKLYPREHLKAAEAGLTATHEDVRLRGLQTLLTSTKRSKPKSGDVVWNLYVRALNDAAPSVRREAFKSAVNQSVGGGGEATLRFALQSIHADIRREVLTELQAQIAEPWSTPLLFEFFNDPAPELRAEAMEVATKKNKELAPLEAALKSEYPNTRVAAIEALFKQHTKAAQAVILTAIADVDAGVRQKAIDSLVEDEAADGITQALDIEQPDVRVRAARARARLGDSKALPVLKALAFAPEPADKQKVTEWRSLVGEALIGLMELGDPWVFDDLLKLLDSPHLSLAQAAARALAECTPPKRADDIRKRLGHADQGVRFWLLQTLANLGDDTVYPQLFSTEFESLSLPLLRLQSVAARGAAGTAGLLSLLDSASDDLRHQALLLHVLLEYAGTDGTPDLLLQALSAQSARVRLAAAQGLEAFPDRAVFEAFVLSTLNDRAEEPAWKLTADVVKDLAAVFAFGDSLLRARAAKLLSHFGQKDSAAFMQALAVFRKRHAAAIAHAKAKLKPTPSVLTQAELRQLAFGAYVGLTREQGSSPGTPAVMRVRQTALSRIHAIATADKAYARDARPILAQSLTDPNGAVRLQAFDHLLALGVPTAELGAEALEAGFTDLGVKGLELQTGGNAGEGDEVLERVLLTRTDDLAIEAAKLLVKSQKLVPVATVALDAVHEQMRTAAVDWLADEYSGSADAQVALRKAVGSRYRNVREQAAFALALKKDPAAFDVLAALLKGAVDAGAQCRIAEAFQALGDKRAAGILIERAENDPAGTADLDQTVGKAATFRVVETVPRLLALAERFHAQDGKPTDRVNVALAAAFCVSGFDQSAPDPDEELEFAEAEKEQHPRHPAALAMVMECMAKHGLFEGDSPFIPASKAARTSEVDPVLGTLSTSTDDDVRAKALEVIAWRARKRKGPVEPLLKALKLKDRTMQFLAAEGLARAGRREGLQILLSGLEYLDDFDLRQRAVLALGELAEPRTVDTLLKLATENGHALQEAAAEAIGHLRNSTKRDEIGKQLERLTKSPMTGVMQRALVGLRWFDSPAGWQILRAKTKDGDWRTRQTACQQLKYDTAPATKTLMLDILRKENDNDAMDAAFASAVHLFGTDSLEPHYAACQNERWADRGMDVNGESPIDGVTKRGDPLRLMDLFPKCCAEVQARVEASLIGRETVPAKEAAAALGRADAATVRLAARLLGRVSRPTADMRKASVEAVKKWWATWQEQRDHLEHGFLEPGKFDATTECLRTLLWTAAQLGGDGGVLIELATGRPDDRLAKPLRLEAMRTLARAEKLGEPMAKAFATLASDPDAEVRTFAASVLAKADVKRTAKLMPSYLTDRPTLARVQAVGGPIGEDVSAAVGNANEQSVALAMVIAKQDVATLATVARNRKALEPVRLGAVEGLGFMTNEDAEKVLVEIGIADGDDEDIRKAAWRALSRSKRRRKKVAK
jgi:ParB family chromosome partitioning protein